MYAVWYVPSVHDVVDDVILRHRTTIFQKTDQQSGCHMGLFAISYKTKEIHLVFMPFLVATHN